MQQHNDHPVVVHVDFSNPCPEVGSCVQCGRHMRVSELVRHLPGDGRRICGWCEWERRGMRQADDDTIGAA